jgi:probable phosphoglycerate mutase
LKLYLIRHLQTPWNKEGKLQGSQDISVLAPSEDDVKKIILNTAILQDIIFDITLTSELVRTQETASYYGIDSFQIEPLLNELDFGQFEGRPKQDLLDAIGDDWYKQLTKITLGESLKGFEMRMQEFISKYQGKYVLVFAHGATIRALKALHEFGHIDSMNQLQVGNNELVILDFPNRDYV